MSTVYVNEIFEKIEKATGEEKSNLLKLHGSQHPYDMLLALNFDDRISLDLPPGVPPYKQDLTIHPDMYQSTLQQQIKRLKTIVKGRADNIAKLRKEYIFIQTLEGIPPKEAEVLLFAKDKALTELYPSITREFVESVFPNFKRT